MGALVSTDSTVVLTAAGILDCGQAVLAPDGRVGIVGGMKPVAVGEVATLKMEGQVSMTAAATLAAGALIGVHIVNQTVVAAGTAGSVVAGTLLYDVTSGGTATFDLNEPSVTESKRAIGASTAAAGSTYADAGALPAATAAVYLTSAADDAKGVILHANDEVTGRVIYIANGVSNKILKVYAPAGGTINGAAANAAFSSASGKGVIMVCVAAATHVWNAF